MFVGSVCGSVMVSVLLVIVLVKLWIGIGVWLVMLGMLVIVSFRFESGLIRFFEKVSVSLVGLVMVVLVVGEDEISCGCVKVVFGRVVVVVSMVVVRMGKWCMIVFNG